MTERKFGRSWRFEPGELVAYVHTRKQVRREAIGVYLYSPSATHHRVVLKVGKSDPLERTVRDEWVHKLNERAQDAIREFSVDKDVLDVCTLIELVYQHLAQRDFRTQRTT